MGGRHPAGGGALRSGLWLPHRSPDAGVCVGERMRFLPPSKVWCACNSLARVQVRGRAVGASETTTERIFTPKANVLEPGRGPGSAASPCLSPEAAH